MKTHTENYTIDKSNERIDEILSPYNGGYEEVSEIPSRDKLTYTNGYYVTVGALFIDMRDSSVLTEIHRKPALSKIYRCFVSECVAVMNSSSYCKEINIDGDCVWGVFDAKYGGIQDMFDTAAMLKSLLKLLNVKFERKNLQTINAGIGMDCGTVLMIRAGKKGTGLNEVLWMGDAVNTACHLANEAGKNNSDPIYLTPNVYDYLDEHSKGLLRKTLFDENYHGDIVMGNMNNWINEHF